MNLLSEEEIFAAAIQKPAAERAAFLDQACAGNPVLKGQVAALLAAHDQPDSLLEVPPGNVTIDSAPRLTEGPGTQIGPYKLLQKFGEGGMGAVYVAEQTEPVKRRVALKVIKPGMDTAQVIARFEAERQALAIMDHTNIAKVLDAGTTETGRPYFVMELVKGVPITKYCDELNLPIRERLALFVPVCQAIQHAHQKGIIHRDVKPTNVLIAMQDGRPVPKVIDFGVAKALHQRLTDRTMMTEFGAVVGTLEYMAPEQAELSALDIDTRADVYGLGVLLYELLTGSTPLDKTRLRNAAYSEMLRMIREEEPPKPSTRLTTAEELPSLAARRRTESARLTKEVRGELDWIVMKCLEKDRTRRYETANGLARDVERYLSDAPVEACPPSAGYRVRKFARKHRAALATATAFATLLMIGVVMSMWQAVRATRAQSLAVAARNAEASERRSAEAQRDRAAKAEEQANIQRDRALAAEKEAKVAAKTAEEERAIAAAVNNFVRHDLLGQVNREGQVNAGFKPDPDIKVRTLLDRASEKVAKRFKDQPRVEAEIRMTIGFSYQQLLIDGQSAPIKTAAVTRQEMRAAAEQHITRALELFEGALGENDRRTLAAVYQVAAMYANFHEYDKAEPYFRRNLEGTRRTLGADSPKLLTSMNNLAYVYGRSGRVKEAVKMLEDALEHARRMSAASASEEKTLVRRPSYILYNLSSYYMDLKRFAEAEPLLREALDKQRQTRGNKDSGTQLRRHNLSVCYCYLDRWAEAEVLQRESLEVQRSRYGEDSAEAAKEVDFLITILKKLRKFAEVDELIQQKVAAARKQSGDQSLAVVTALVQLAIGRLDQQRHADAEPLLREALTIREKLSPDQTGNVRSLLGASLAGQGKHAEAEPLLIAGYEGMKARLKPADNPALVKFNLASGGERLVRFYEQLDQPAEAARWREDLAEGQRLTATAVKPDAEQPDVPQAEQPVPDFTEQR